MGGVVRVTFIENPFSKAVREQHVQLAGRPLRVYAPSWFEEDNPHHVCIWNGAAISHSMDAVAAVNDDLCFINQPGVSAAVVTAVFGSSAIWANVIAVGINVGIGLALQALVRPGRKAIARGERESPTYSFLGIESNYNGEGSVKPVVYGHIRTGGVVIQRFTRVESSPPVTTLYILIQLSEGLIHGVGDKRADGGPFRPGDPTAPLPAGLEINGQRAEDMQGIEAYVRLGGNNQELIPYFEDTSTQANVGQELTNTQGSEDNQFVGLPLFSREITDATVTVAQLEAAWPEAVFYTMGDEADTAAAIINFPQGLFSVDGNGQTAGATVYIQMAYVEVDDVGTPITGADYVVLPRRGVANAFTSPFQMELATPFYEHSEWGGVIKSPFVDGYSISNGVTLSSATGFNSHPANMPGKDVEWSFSTWLRPRICMTDAGGGTGGGSAYGAFVAMLASSDTPDGDGVIATSSEPIMSFEASNRGFSIILERQPNGFVYKNPAGANDIAPLQVRVRLSNTLSTDEIILKGAALDAAVYSGIQGFENTVYQGQFNGVESQLIHMPWLHMAVTYKSDPNENGFQRLRLYINGQLVDEAGQAEGMDDDYRWPADGTTFMLIGSLISGYTNSYQGYMGVTRLYDKEKSQGHFITQYNGGQGTIGAPGEASEGVIAGWSFVGTLSDFVGDEDLIPTGVPDLPSFSAAQTWGYSPTVTLPFATQLTGRKWKLALQRLTPTGSDAQQQYGADQTVWDTVRLTTLQPYTNPGEALLGLKIRATGQLSSSAPTVTVPVYGRVVDLIDEHDGLAFSAPATFVPKYTDNPAWLSLDALSNQNYGAGDRYSPSSFDLFRLTLAAQYFEEYIYAGGERAELDTTVTAVQNVVANTDGDDVESVTFSIVDGDQPSDLSRWVGSFIKVNATYGVTLGSGFGQSKWRAYEVTLLEFIDGSPDRWELTARLVHPSDAGESSPHSTHTYAAGEITGGSIERVSRRYTFNGVFDRAGENPWDAFVAILAVARTAPVIVGGRISFFIDQPRDAVALVSMNNCVQGSYVRAKTAAGQLANVSAVQFLDEAQNWEPLSVDDPSNDVTDVAAGNAIKPREVFRLGVTNRAQAIRMARLDTRTLRAARNAYQWTQALEAISYEIGDVVEFQHNRVRGTVGGKTIQDSVLDGRIYLDQPVSIAYGTAYFVRGAPLVGLGVESYSVDIAATVGTTLPGGFPHVVQVGEPVVLAAGTTGAYPLTDLTQVGASYAFGAAASKTVQIIGFSKKGRSPTVDVQSMDYDGTIYEDAEDLEQIDVAGATENPGGQQASLTTKGLPDHPVSVSVDEDNDVGEAGEIVTAARLRWRVVGPMGREAEKREASTKNERARVAVWFTARTSAYRESNLTELTWRSLGEVPMGAEAFRVVEPMRRGATYCFALQAIGEDGAAQALERCPRAYLTPSGKARPRSVLVGASTRAVGERSVLTVPEVNANRNAAWEARRGGWVLGQKAGHGRGPVIPLEGFCTAKESTATGAARPLLHVRALYGNGQVGSAIVTQEAAPARSGSWTNLVDVTMEDASWAGTLTDLQIEAAPSNPELLPAIDRGTKLKWTGSNLTASYVPAQALFAAPIWVWVSAHVDALQVSPITVDDQFAIGGLPAETISTEGDLDPDVDKCALTFEWRITDEGSFDGSEPWIEFLPGRHRFRLAEFRASFTRPDANHDVRVRRFSVRITRLPARRLDAISSQSFARI